MDFSENLTLKCMRSHALGFSDNQQTFWRTWKGTEMFTSCSSTIPCSPWVSMWKYYQVLLLCRVRLQSEWATMVLVTCITILPPEGKLEEFGVVSLLLRPGKSVLCIDTSKSFSSLCCESRYTALCRAPCCCCCSVAVLSEWIYSQVNIFVFVYSVTMWGQKLCNSCGTPRPCRVPFALLVGPEALLDPSQLRAARGKTL